MAKVSTLDLKNVSLAKLIVGYGKNELTGCLKLIKERPKKQRLNIWFRKGMIVGISSKLTLVERVQRLGLISERLIPNLKRDCENLANSLGMKLERAYDVSPENIAQLFEAQLNEIREHLGEREGRIGIAKIKAEDLPLTELTGQEISAEQFVKESLTNNFYSRYVDAIPVAQQTIKSGTNQLRNIKLNQEEAKIVSFAGSNINLSQIARKTEISLKKVQIIAYILSLIEVIELTVPQSRTIILNRFNNQNPQEISQNNLIAPIAIAATNMLIIFAMVLGLFQDSELKVLNRLIKLKGTEKNEDIVIVTIDDQDIAKFKTYPIADKFLAQTLNNIAAANPTAIGLDIYRDLPQEPGHQKLLESYENITQLFGVEKVDKTKPVNPPPILDEQGRVGFADLVIDSDGTVRRSVWLVEDAGKIKFSLGGILALQHLANFSLDKNNQLVPAAEFNEPVAITQDENDPYRYTFGKTTFDNIKPGTGGYWRKEVVGTQKIIAFRHNTTDFAQLSFYNVYESKFDPRIIQDKIVLIGVTADSKKDFVFSPLSAKSNQARLMPGVIAHANIAAEFINAARGIKPIQINSKTWEIFYVIFWSIMGIGLGIAGLELSLKYQNQKTNIVLLQYVVMAGASAISAVISFLLISYWIPFIPALTAGFISIAIINSGQQKALKCALYLDRESNLVKRSYFERQFDKMFADVKLTDSNLGLILCQIEDYSKLKSKLPKSQFRQYISEIAKITKKVIQNRDSLTGRFTDEIVALILTNTNEIELKEITNDINKLIKVNKTIIKIGIPRLKFAYSLSDNIKNNSLSLIADTDEKLMEE